MFGRSVEQAVGVAAADGEGPPGPEDFSSSGEVWPSCCAAVVLRELWATKDEPSARRAHCVMQPLVLHP